jgi:hypothetical protein
MIAAEGGGSSRLRVPLCKIALGKFVNEFGLADHHLPLGTSKWNDRVDFDRFTAL